MLKWGVPKAIIKKFLIINSILTGSTILTLHRSTKTVFDRFTAPESWLPDPLNNRLIGNFLNIEITVFKTDYTFDGKYFENIEKIGAFQPIINLKNAIQQENEEKLNVSIKVKIVKKIFS